MHPPLEVRPVSRLASVASVVSGLAALALLAVTVVVAVQLLRVEAVATGDVPVVSSADVVTTTGASTASGPVRGIDPAWLASTAAATGIPPRALAAYASASLVAADESPQCGLGWNTVAAIGAIETGHGTHGDSAIDPDGWARPAILGPRLDGQGFAAIRDTDGGLLDGDTTWDRAVGPLQFIPSTWARWGADGNGDGVADPHQIDDAALAAVRYLCHGGSTTTPAEWRRAVFSYNHSDAYVDQVAARANTYAGAVGG
ncbi:lytic transglycosylase domain-containing protein [Aeromicrobium sp. Leaf350]|uniref:lytic transglycosylase domain-containing protein n=1 Tax=Aeromicrobium sp. Leaf350 TaxID=2876565 RepID=UPI001E6325AF|nr:lytic transglycosylase domain-containing protein [Aeromicrobium sp. Leaf350]